MSEQDLEDDDIPATGRLSPPPDSDARSEWLKFGILAAVFIISVVVVGLIAPLIGSWIVPAVLGTNNPKPVVTESAPPTMVPVDPTAETAAPTLESSTENSTSESSMGLEPVPTVAPAASPTPANVLLYTIQPGDNLTKISILYGVTIQQIVDANPELKNPNQISPGTQLRIPRP